MESRPDPVALMTSHHEEANPAPEIRLPKTRAVALFLCAVAFFFGALALAGWIFDRPHWRSFLANGSQMKANTAVCLLFLATALALQITRGPKILRILAVFLASFVGLIAGLTLWEYFSATQLDLDQLFFHDTSTVGTSHPGRMSPPSAAVTPHALSAAVAHLFLVRPLNRLFWDI